MLVGLGDLAADEGDSPRRPRRMYREALAVRSQLGDRVGVAAMLERLAGVADGPAGAGGAADRLPRWRCARTIGAPLSRRPQRRARAFLAGLRESAAVRECVAGASWPRADGISAGGGRVRLEH